MPKDQFTKFPSRVPPHYVQTVLQRLLPISPESIAHLDKSALADLAQKRNELISLITNDPVRFFQPSPGGQYDFLTCADSSIQGLYFFAGNKSGKTTGAAILVGENAAGQPLWNRSGRTINDLLLRGRAPLRICCFCEDFSTHEETIVPTLLSWIPRRLLAPKPIERGPSGNITKIIFDNGSHIYLRTYDQGYEKAEGKDYDLVWCDEPPSRDIYTAIWRGLVATKGRIVIAATLLSETWLYDELANPFIKVFEATMYDNSWLDAEGRANFEALLDDEERNIRIFGKPSNLTGLIYPTFRDEAPFIVPLAPRIWDPFTEDPYPIIAAVDPHERKGVYIEWAWLTPQDEVVWFKWKIIPPGRISNTFELILREEFEHSGPTKLVIMDPNRGRARQIDDRSWEIEFQEHSYDVLLGNDNVTLGHSKLREMLATKAPAMRWMESCRGKFGPIYQMLRYSWDDYGRGLRRRGDRAPKEKPKEVHKDFPDIHRYTAMADLSFDTLTRGYKPLQLGNARTRLANPYA